MSHHEWEEGSLILPTAGFSKLRRSMAEDHNRWSEFCFEVAQKIHTSVALALKGKRLPDVRQAVVVALQAHREAEERSHRDRWGFSTQSSNRLILDDDAEFLIQQKLLNEVERGSSRGPSLRRPLKKDFPSVPLTCNDYSNGEASVSFDSAKRTVTWSVSENNHAVDRAWDSHLGRAFSQGLKQVTWTRGSGGSFLYNDEYNRDAERDYEGGGGSHVSRRFGPLGLDPMERMRRPATAARTIKTSSRKPR